MKTTTNAKISAGSESGTYSGGTVNQFTMQQIEALLKMLPTSSKQSGPDTNDEFDGNCAGIMSCFLADSVAHELVVDSSASDHMTCCYDNLISVVISKNKPKINFPTGHAAKVTHVGNVKLENDLMLKDVLYVPAFKDNLIYVNKFLQHSRCKVMFYSTYRVIEDIKTIV